MVTNQNGKVDDKLPIKNFCTIITKRLLAGDKQST